MRLRSVAAGLGAISLTATAAVAATNGDGLGGLVRCARATALVTKATLRFQMMKRRDLEPDAYKAARKQWQLQTADDLSQLCLRHGGLYAKLGQYLATMNHVLPQEITQKFSVLQDRTLPIGFDEVRQIVETELGAPIESIFEDFSPAPVASASIAQVHRARLSHSVDETTPEVAVKVQFNMTRQIEGDLFTLNLVTWMMQKAFPETTFLNWMSEEFEECTRLELDFEQEARNAARLKRLLSDMRDVHVPKTFPTLSTKKVMTMEYVQGCRVTDTESIKSLGGSPTGIAQRIVRVFGDMIHVFGFVHCDPHPGNMMVRKDPESNRIQLVILDHGNYRRLDGHFRASYCLLWKAMLLTHPEMGRQALHALNLPDMYFDILSLMLTYRPGGGSTRLGTRMSKEERQKLREKFKDWDRSDTSEFLGQLPRDLLFVLRTTSLIRSVNKDLGGTSRERLRALGASAIRGLTLVKDHEILDGRLKDTSLSLAAASYANLNEPVTAELRGPIQWYEDAVLTFQLWRARLTLLIADVSLYWMGW